MDSFVPTCQKNGDGYSWWRKYFCRYPFYPTKFSKTRVELMEAHRSISVSWSKFGRNISVELALDTRKTCR